MTRISITAICAILVTSTAAPAQTSGEGPPAPPLEIAQNVTAVALFSQRHCPFVRVDRDVLTKRIRSLGFDPVDFGKDLNAMVGVSQTIKIMELADLKRGCELIWSGYGDRGTALPNMLVRTYP